MNIFEQQADNKRNTWLLLVVFVLFLLVLGLGFDRFVLGTQGPSVPLGGLAALGFGSISALTSYFAGDRAVLLSSGALPLERALEEASDTEQLELKQLDNVVAEMSIASGLPRPKVYVVPDADPNAFATGRSPEHASVSVTRGLLQVLNRDELQGVIAHEMSHIRNYDIRLMTVIAALFGAIALLSDWAARGVRFGGSRRRGRDSGGGAIGLLLLAIWLVAIILAPLVGQLLALAVSRRREYLADASGAGLTRNPASLAQALEKIESIAAPTQAIKRGSAHLCIADPLGRAAGLREGFWADLLATHPPMAKRIAALRAMAYEVQ
jgi:heat shock protein HtpX